MRIVFWGTPDFATPALRALIGEGHDVASVVTQPDRPRERGGRSRSSLDPSPVKAVAVEEGLPVLQPESPKDRAFTDELRAFEAEISIVVAYGHILPREVIEIPRRGTLNVHASLLPAYRGAAPIQAAIRDGLDETGVTIMRMVPALDAGPILLALPLPIEPDETGGELQLRLAELGAQGLIEALALLELGKITDRAQDEGRVSFARKVTRESARIAWTEPAAVVARAVRAYDPRPGAWTTREGAEVRLFGARAVAGRSGAPGEVLVADADGLLVGCGVGAVRIAEVHPAGKRRQSAGDWARGRGVAIKDRLGS